MLVNLVVFIIFGKVEVWIVKSYLDDIEEYGERIDVENVVSVCCKMYFFLMEIILIIVW